MQGERNSALNTLLELIKKIDNKEFDNSLENLNLIISRELLF
jgi:hypothetical protein